MNEWIASIVAVLASACGGRVLDLGHDPSPGRYATPETIRAEANAAPGVAKNTDEALRERGVIRSCEPNDCAATLITHASEQSYASIAVAGGKIYWSNGDSHIFA